MDDSKLKKIEAELKKARMKRDEWDRKVKDLERKYREAENTCIHDMVHAANLSPEQLAEFLKLVASGNPVVNKNEPAGKHNVNDNDPDEDEYDESEDTEDEEN